VSYLDRNAKTTKSHPVRTTISVTLSLAIAILAEVLYDKIRDEVRVLHIVHHDMGRFPDVGMYFMQRIVLATVLALFASYLIEKLVSSRWQMMLVLMAVMISAWVLPQ